MISGKGAWPDNPVLEYLHDIRTELQILNLQTKYSVETEELILGTLQRVFAVARSMVVKIYDLKGNILMPATLTIGQTAQAVATEFTGLNGTGALIPNAGTIGWTSSAPAIATVDPASGIVTAVGSGTANIVGLDSANGLTNFDVVSDQPIVAQSMVVTVTAIPLS
jgi:hypothetical protein